MPDQSQTPDETELHDTDRYTVDETPDLKPSRQQERDHRPDDYTTGYDPSGDTRVGIGSAGGDVSKLIRHNEGRHRSDGNHSTREAARDKKRITQSFCSALDVTPYQQREAVAAMGRLNLDRFGHQKRLEKVALATIKVIVERDRFHQFRQTSVLATITDEMMPNRMLDDSQFCDLLDQYEVSRKDLYSVSQLVKRELKKRNHFGPPVRDPSSGDPSDTESRGNDK